MFRYLILIGLYIIYKYNTDGVIRVSRVIYYCIRQAYLPTFRYFS